MRSAVLCDISQFIGTPLCSGIQRVVYEIVSSWPKHVELVLCTVNSESKLIELDPSVFPLMKEFFTAGPKQSEAAREQLKLAPTKAVRVLTDKEVGQYQAVLIPELFFDPVRVQFYERLLAGGYSSIYSIIYDIIPWIHPDWFSAGAFRQR